MTIRFGIAGLRHAHVSMMLEAISRRSDVQLIAIAEENGAIRNDYASRLGVPAYRDYREMIAMESLDALGAVPIPGNRADVVIAGLDAGLHVLSDKPLCTTSEDLARIALAWRMSDRLLSMLLNKRFMPVSLAARDLVRSGRLGEIALVSASAPHKLHRATRPDWMWSRSTYGGIVNDLCIHDIDLVLWLCGIRAGTVQGTTGNLAHPEYPEFEDIGQCLMRGANGSLVALDAHWLSPDHAPAQGDYRMVLTGTRGTAELRFAFNELAVATEQDTQVVTDLSTASSVVDDFFDAINQGKPGVIQAGEVFLATRIALLAQEHANQGAWLPWETPTQA